MCLGFRFFGVFLCLGFGVSKLSDQASRASVQCISPSVYGMLILWPTHLRVVYPSHLYQNLKSVPMVDDCIR